MRDEGTFLENKMSLERAIQIFGEDAQSTIEKSILTIKQSFLKKPTQYINMPIARVNNKTIYFSHIPKCGGSSIEDFLRIIAKSDLCFLDRSYDNGTHQWSISSPQHITGKEISKLFPINFFDLFLQHLCRLLTCVFTQKNCLHQYI